MHNVALLKTPRERLMKNQIKPETVNQVMGITEWSLIILLSVIWGGSFFFIGVTVKELPPFTIVLSRVGLAAIILLAVVYLSGNRMPSSLRIWGSFLILGGLNNVIPFVLIVWGQTHIESGMASILNATTPIFSVVLTHFMTKEEKLTPNRIIGVVVGWGGVAVLIGMDAFHGFGIANLGQVAVLGASLTYAFAAIYARRFKKLKPIVVATGMLCCSTITMLPITLLIDKPWTLAPGTTTLFALIGLAVVPRISTTAISNKSPNLSSSFFFNSTV